MYRILYCGTKSSNLFSLFQKSNQKPIPKDSLTSRRGNRKCKKRWLIARLQDSFLQCSLKMNVIYLCRKVEVGPKLSRRSLDQDQLALGEASLRWLKKKFLIWKSSLSSIYNSRPIKNTRDAAPRLSRETKRLENVQRHRPIGGTDLVILLPPVLTFSCGWLYRTVPFTEHVSLGHCETLLRDFFFPIKMNRNLYGSNQTTVASVPRSHSQPPVVPVWQFKDRLWLLFLTISRGFTKPQLIFFFLGVSKRHVLVFVECCMRLTFTHKCKYKCSFVSFPNHYSAFYFSR